MSDEGLRIVFSEQVSAAKQRTGKARAVRVQGGVVLHPDDHDAQMTRLPARRAMATKRRSRR